MSSADFGGRAKRGGGSASGSLRRSSTHRQAIRPATVSTVAAIRWCTRASLSIWAASVPPAEPSSAPELHMPCRLDMIDLSRRFSISTPRAFIATSDMPEVAP